MSNLLFSDIETVSAMMKNKELSPVELLKETMDRIKKYEPELNAFITVMEEEAAGEARRAEADIQQGNNKGPLHGIPIAVKDILQTNGVRTTGGSKIFENWFPDEDAVSVQKLRQAGAVIIGKANLHEFAMGATTENPHFGNAKNPWDLKKIPGGSSGGSAVATAAGMAFGALGTDTAGSIRLPAAICGTVGFKPTYDLVSREGSFPFSWSLDHVGPMTRTVNDAAHMLNVLSSTDSSEKLDKSWLNKPMDNLKGITLGFHEKYMYAGIEPEVKRVIEKAFQQLEKLGAKIIPIELPLIDEALDALRKIAQSEVITYHEPLLEKYEAIYGNDLKYRFQFGSDISAKDYINAQRTRKLFIQKTLRQMADIDALIGPTNVQEPFNIGTMVPEQAISNMFTLGKTPLANILGFPALSVASGFTENSLPVGLQIIGKPHEDMKVLQIGSCYERSEGWVEKLKENKNYINPRHDAEKIEK
ncbi:aspartyl-tRNA(Asn)/glutamyl-tRNA(Gln) amidotransferase subunit A [Alteribacillus persepolensis]|uniref:Aspartyl-tRNA(Asn)/glutamyl-tRNA(Gln) amidotransferase subunit A n=1 Tax=Alteribacillus persepolensis TaxID=568899 RepID=A0A1G8JBB9_9BACI|nr:amidase [Alteribacillus persepolensis]SDI28535.1 aspartyl-tRNA(Asn)/glutamyl-tRNA(Gln) amidotransferase subunit A [Alteribacillus persepolensis]